MHAQSMRYFMLILLSIPALADQVVLKNGDTITGNTTGVSQASASSVFTLKNNSIAGNTTDVSGTLTAYPGGLQ